MLEHPKKLIHYDLRFHTNEWSLSRIKRSVREVMDEPTDQPPQVRSKRSTPILSEVNLMDEAIDEASVNKTKRVTRTLPVTQLIDVRRVIIDSTIKAETVKHLPQALYHRKVYKLLNVLNRVGPSVWYWSFDELTHTISLSIKMGTRYGIMVSPGLKRILNLKSRLFLPKDAFYQLKNSGAYPLKNDAANQVSGKLRQVRFWKQHRMTITLLPLARLRKTVIRVKPGSFKDFADSVKGHPQFHFNEIMMEKAPKKYMFIYDNESVSNVLFATANQSSRTYLSLPFDVFWKKKKYHRIKLADQQKGCIVTLFHTDVEPPSASLITWNAKSEVKVPSKYYSNGYDLCSQLNKGDRSQFDYEFGYDVQSNKFNITARGKVVVKISKDLATTLGFSRNVFHKETVEGKPSLLNMNINHLYIYANFIQPTEVGGALVPLLRYSPIDSGLFGQIMYKEFLNKVYVPVIVSRLHHLEFGIYDDTGKLIDFSGGRTVLTLHLRKVK